jgi:hypothetical protein
VKQAIEDLLLRGSGYIPDLAFLLHDLHEVGLA